MNMNIDERCRIDNNVALKMCIVELYYKQRGIFQLLYIQTLYRVPNRASINLQIDGVIAVSI